MKRELPVALAFFSGAIIVAAYFFDFPALQSFSKTYANWRVIVAAFALGLGGINMMRIHGRNVSEKKQNWVYSIIFFVSFACFFIMGVAKGSASPGYQYIWTKLYQPASAAMYSFTLFYMTSASYRAFRIRNWQAAVLMVTGAIVILGQVGIGAAISRFIPLFSEWLIEYPNAAAIRAITIGGSLGMINVSLRIILGLERTYMPGGDVQ